MVGFLPDKPGGAGLRYKPLSPGRSVFAGGLQGLGQYLLALGSGQPQNALAAFQGGLQGFEEGQYRRAEQAERQEDRDYRRSRQEQDDAERAEKKAKEAQAEAKWGAFQTRLTDDDPTNDPTGIKDILPYLPPEMQMQMAPDLFKGAEPPKSRERREGSQTVFEEFDPKTGMWNQVSSGPAWAPQPPKEPKTPGITTLYDPDGQPKSLFDDDPSIPQLLAEGWIDDKPASNTVMVQTGVDSNGQPIYEMQSSKGPKALTEGQSIGTMQFSLADQANTALGELDTVLTNTRDYIASKFGTAGNFFKSPEYQKAEQSATVMAEQYLRALTGAAAPDAEVARTAKSILPQPGDSDDVIKQKRATRLVIIEALRIKAGPGADKITPPQAPTDDGGYTIEELP